MNEWLTTHEAAAVLRVHEKTVRRMILRGELEAVKVGHIYRIHEDALPTSRRPPKPRRSRYRPTGSVSAVVAEMEAAAR